jgi:hypothetical protein
MEFFKVIQLNENDILLQKVNINLDKYNVTYQDDGNIALKKKEYINISNIKNLTNYNLNDSSILECVIDDIKLNILQYKTIIEYIYNKINDGSKIIKNTNIDITTSKKKDNNYYNLDKLGIGYRISDKDFFYNCLNEIYNQCVMNKFKLFIQIKLTDNKIINFTNKI